MSIEAGITAYLQAALPGVVYYPHAVPRSKQYPAKVYTLDSCEHAAHLTGSSGMATATITFSHLSHDYTDCIAGAENLRLVLQGYRGPLGTLTCTGSLLLEDNSSYDPPTDDSDNGVHTKSSTYQVSFVEPRPSFTP